MFKENSLVDGIYCSTHSGHDNDLRYLALTMDEKREIYGNLNVLFSFSFALISDIISFRFNKLKNFDFSRLLRKYLFLLLPF